MSIRTVTSILVFCLVLVQGATLPKRDNKVSAACQAVINGFISDKHLAGCTNAKALSDLVAAGNMSSFNPDMYPIALDKWLSGMCATAPCINTTIAAISDQVIPCVEVAGYLGIGPSTMVSTSTAVRDYRATRRAMCLKDTKKDKLCVTELARTKNVTDMLCSDCTKEVYNIANETGTSIANVTFLPGPNATNCGSNFTDGKTPKNIREIAVAAKNSSSGAVPTHAAWRASMLLFLACVIVVLA